MFTRSYKTGSASSTKERNTTTTSSLRCGTCHGNMNSVSLFVGDIMHSVLHTVSGRTADQGRIICTIHKYMAILRIAYCIVVSGQAERKATACGIVCAVVVRTIHDYTAKSAGFANIIFRKHHISQTPHNTRVYSDIAESILHRR